jgi:hypothetical protein
MNSRTRTLTIALASALACATLHAQTAETRPPRDLGAIVMPSEAIEEMKTALRELIAAEEKIYGDHDTYTTSVTALDRYVVYHGQVQVQVTFASKRAWTAVATEPSLKGKSCVIYVGAAKDIQNSAPKTMGGVVAKEEGVPVCDEP